jgi:hypothetical protein
MSWLEQVREDGLMLLNVPEELKTPDLCRAAVEQCSNALSYVPTVMREQARAALKRNQTVH